MDYLLRIPNFPSFNISMAGNFPSSDLPHTPSAGLIHTSPNGASSKQTLHAFLFFFSSHHSSFLIYSRSYLAADLTINSVQKWKHVMRSKSWNDPTLKTICCTEHQLIRRHAHSCSEQEAFMVLSEKCLSCNMLLLYLLYSKCKLFPWWSNACKCKSMFLYRFNNADSIK